MREERPSLALYGPLDLRKDLNRPYSVPQRVMTEIMKAMMFPLYKDY